MPPPGPESRTTKCRARVPATVSAAAGELDCQIVSNVSDFCPSEGKYEQHFGDSHNISYQHFYPVLRRRHALRSPTSSAVRPQIYKRNAPCRRGGHASVLPRALYGAAVTLQVPLLGARQCARGRSGSVPPVARVLKTSAGWRGDYGEPCRLAAGRVWMGRRAGPWLRSQGRQVEKRRRGQRTSAPEA